MLSCRQLEREEWPSYDELVRRSPHGSIFSLSTWEADRVYGIFKGQELIGGCPVRCVEGEFSTPMSTERQLRMARYVEYTPWQGVVMRSTDEGENISAVHSLMARLFEDFDEITLFLPPQWTDVRPFRWYPCAGMPPFWTHIYYTYRGYGDYEKRVNVEMPRLCKYQDGKKEWIDCPAEISSSPMRFSITNRLGSIQCLGDWRCVYYWKATGTDHSYLLHLAIQKAKAAGLDFDFVGANSGAIGLFKRGFGGKLTPYYAVTTCTEETRNLRSMPVASLHRGEARVPDLPQGHRGGERQADVLTAA